MKKRGLYSRDLIKTIKARVDEETFSHLQKLAEEKNESLSSILRGIISNSLQFKTSNL